MHDARLVMECVASNFNSALRSILLPVKEAGNTSPSNIGSLYLLIHPDVSEDKLITHLGGGSKL